MSPTPFVLCLALLLSGHTVDQGVAKVSAIYELRADEGVFAYSRISPDGRYLAFASESRDPTRPARLVRTVNVVELASKKVLFSEPGVDAYWSPNGERMIFLSHADGLRSVSIRDNNTNVITRDVAPVELGDYYSWGVGQGGRDVILTIESYYYTLKQNEGELPPSRVPSCEPIGRGERPLLSKDGRRITTFVQGTIVVRGLADCGSIVYTGIQGAKADFSFDGRYIAFHAPKPVGSGYSIRVVDLEKRTVRTLDALEGSSFFPSWTRDGRLSFRYDDVSYRGFMMVSNVMSLAEVPLAARLEKESKSSWLDLFPETVTPSQKFQLVLLWGPWSAHAAEALAAVDSVRIVFTSESASLSVLAASDPASSSEDVSRALHRYDVHIPHMPLSAQQRNLSELTNQNPVVLLFRNGSLIDRKLGAQSVAQLERWLAENEIRRRQ